MCSHIEQVTSNHILLWRDWIRSYHCAIYPTNQGTCKVQGAHIISSLMLALFRNLCSNESRIEWKALENTLGRSLSPIIKRHQSKLWRKKEKEEKDECDSYDQKVSWQRMLVVVSPALSDIRADKAMIIRMVWRRKVRFSNMFFSLLQLCFLFDYEFLSDFNNETTNSFVEENFMTEMEHNEKKSQFKFGSNPDNFIQNS